MLEQLFAGDPGGELQPPQLTETAWEKSDVYNAIKRMKLQKSADERGLVAELLKYAPDFFIAKLVDSFHDLMTSGDVPREWDKTLFKMLPKNSRAKVPPDFRPIANIRLFYKLFAYMILGRTKAQLESTQPEEQHGFRSGRRVEEHLVTTQLVFDKLLRANVPIWIISLDLSKAFDRVHWPALWACSVPTRSFKPYDLDSPKLYTGTKKDKSLQMMFAVDHSRYVVACDKAVF